MYGMLVGSPNRTQPKKSANGKRNRLINGIIGAMERFLKAHTKTRVRKPMFDDYGWRRDDGFF